MEGSPKDRMLVSRGCRAVEQGRLLRFVKWHLGLVWALSGRSWSALRTSDRWKIVTFFQSSVWSNWDLNGTSMRLSLLSWKTTECSTLHVAIDPTHSTSGVFLNVCPLLLFWPHQPAFYQGSRRHCEYSAHPVSQTKYSIGSIGIGGNLIQFF